MGEFHRVNGNWVADDGGSSTPPLAMVDQNADGSWPEAPSNVQKVIWVWKVAGSSSVPTSGRPYFDATAGDKVLRAISGVAASPGGGTSGGGTTTPPPANTVPSAPVLTLTPGNQVIQADHSSGGDGGLPITGKEVYRNNPDWSIVDPATSSSRTLTGFNNGTEYTVGVRYQNSLGWGPWTYKNATPTGTIADPGTGGTSGTTALARPKHPLGLYDMIYTAAGYPKLSTMPSEVNVIPLAFMIGTPPVDVGYGSEGSYAALRTAVQAHRAAGRRVVLSYGGSGAGAMNMADRTAWINSAMNFHNNVAPIDGIDFDLEGTNAIDGKGSDGKYHAVYIMEQLRLSGARGANFFATMAPNGTTISKYLPVGKALQDAGIPLLFGQQFYDATVSEAAMLGRLSEAFNTFGILPSNYWIGIMPPYPLPSYGNTSMYWDVATAKSRIAAAQRAYPTLAGAYVWERSRQDIPAMMTGLAATMSTWP